MAIKSSPNHWCVLTAGTTATQCLSNLATQVCLGSSSLFWPSWQTVLQERCFWEGALPTISSLSPCILLSTETNFILNFLLHRFHESLFYTLHLSWPLLPHIPSHLLLPENDWLGPLSVSLSGINEYVSVKIRILEKLTLNHSWKIGTYRQKKNVPREEYGKGM